MEFPSGDSQDTGYFTKNNIPNGNLLFFSRCGKNWMTFRGNVYCVFRVRVRGISRAFFFTKNLWKTGSRTSQKIAKNVKSHEFSSSSYDTKKNDFQLKIIIMYCTWSISPIWKLLRSVMHGKLLNLLSLKFPMA